MKKTLLAILLFLSSNSYSESLCIAHRGNNKDFLENTYQSIKSAFEVGSEGVEFDVVHTKDGKALVFHDRDLKRLAIHKTDKKCNLRKNINKQIYLDIKNNCILTNGEEIPTLENILELLSEKNIIKFIELKDFPSLHTLELIERYSRHAPEKVRIISFKKKILNYINLMSMEIPIFQRIKLMRLYRYTPRKKPTYGLNLHYSKKALKKLILNFHIKDSGMWTVDDEEEIISLLEAGIGYITTNDPKKCLKLKSQI